MGWVGALGAGGLEMMARWQIGGEVTVNEAAGVARLRDVVQRSCVETTKVRLICVWWLSRHNGANGGNATKHGSCRSRSPRHALCGWLLPCHHRKDGVQPSALQHWLGLEPGISFAHAHFSAKRWEGLGAHQRTGAKRTPVRSGLSLRRRPKKRESFFIGE